MSVFEHFICSFIGTIAFSVLFNVPKRYYVWCGLTGTAGWVLYVLLVEASVTDTMATFFGTIIVVLMSRILAIHMKCPITIFLVSGIFPLIPGASVYYTAYYIVVNELSDAVTKGLLAVKIAFAIVLGIVFIVSIPKKYFIWENIVITK